MRLLLALFLTMPLAAQEPAQKPPEKAEEAKKDEKAAETPAPAPGESWGSGSIDVGYRFTDVHGNNNVYRSVVNTQDGVRLVGLDLNLQDPSKRAFDRLNLFVNNWGDPYNTLRADVSKLGLYRFLADYRSIDYFNNLPSFANPLANRGNLMSERAFDTNRKYTNLALDLLPGRWITPYFAYSRDWSNGNGIAPFVMEGTNEYPVPMTLKDRTDNYRGGVRVELKNYHLTLEAGGTQYLEDARADFSSKNYSGNRFTPSLGQLLYLNTLSQLYDITGSSKYTRVMFTGTPYKWAKVFGQLLYSQPESKVSYSDNAAGNFVMMSTLRFYNGQQDLVSSIAKQPHTSGNGGVEIQVFKGLRLVESFWTDRFHNASAALLTEQLMFAGSVPAETAKAYLNNQLLYNYNRNRLDAFWDVFPKLTVRGGFHYVWGDARVRAGQLNPFTTSEFTEIQQKIGTGGFTLRPTQKLNLNADYEGATSPKNFFRTSLRDYQRLRARGRYQVNSELQFNVSFNFLDNQNPTPGMTYDMRQQFTSGSVQWMPKFLKGFTLIGDYTRSTFRSNIQYRDPGDASTNPSFYKDNANVATALGDFSLPVGKDMAVKVSFGGSLFVSSGSRPTTYYQPIGRVSVPVRKFLQMYGEWRWYGYSETFYGVESFRSNQFLTGLRFSI